MATPLPLTVLGQKNAKKGKNTLNKVVRPTNPYIFGLVLLGKHSRYICMATPIPVFVSGHKSQNSLWPDISLELQT